MSYFDDASLVMIPSGYKDQKIFSVKPLDGSGDLAFSRASSATRVASNGLIEKVRTNTIPYSQAFDNAAWTKDRNGTGVTPVVTANNATAPDGTLTADTIVFDAGAGTTTGDSSVVYQAIAATGLCTASFYARVTSGTGQLVYRSVGGATYTTANLTTTWQRFSAAENGSSGFFEIGIRRGLSNEPINASVTVQMWGAQLEVGDIATDYIATTTTAVSVGPVSGLPRLDYLNSSCPRLLLESSRTSLVNFSEQLNNAYWTQNATVTANSTISPSGYQDADTLTDSSNSYLDVRRSFTITASTAYTFSIFVKKTTGTLTNYAGVGFSAGGGVGTGYAIFNTTTGVVNLADVAGDFVLSAKSTSYGDYYRFEMTFTTGQTSLLVLIYPALSQNGTTLSSNAQGSNVFWGVQLEAGTYATSYIPTLGTSVTRVADAASKTGISSLIGQTEGTLFAEIDFNGTGFGSDNDFFIYVGNGSNTNSIYIDYFNNLFRFVVFTGGSLTAYFDTATTNGTHKIALAYKSGSYAAYKDGVQIGVDAAVANPPTCSIFSLGGGASGFSSITKNTKQALLFKTRLTNAQLAELTTL